MEAYKRWVRKNQHWLSSFESLANTLTWLLPDQLANSELAPEALSTLIGLVTALNQHIVDTAPKTPHPGIRMEAKEDTSVPWMLWLSVAREIEVLSEMVAEHYQGKEDKWTVVAAVEALKTLLRLAIYRKRGYRILINGGDTSNEDADTPQSSREYMPQEPFRPRGYPGAPPGAGVPPGMGPLPYPRGPSPPGMPGRTPPELEPWAHAGMAGGPPPPPFPGAPREGPVYGMRGGRVVPIVGKGEMALHMFERFRKRLGVAASDDDWGEGSTSVESGGGGASEASPAVTAERWPPGTAAVPSWRDPSGRAGGRRGAATGNEPGRASGASVMGRGSPGEMAGPSHQGFEHWRGGVAPPPPFAPHAEVPYPGLPPGPPPHWGFPPHPPPGMGPPLPPPRHFMGHGGPADHPLLPSTSASHSSGQAGPGGALGRGGTGSGAWAGRCMVTGELLHIVRPLLYALAIRRWGRRSWRPWLLSLTLDASSHSLQLAAHSLHTRTLREGEVAAGSPLGGLLPHEMDELRRRRLMWALYLLRSPFFDEFTKGPLDAIERTMKNVPVLGMLTDKGLEFLLSIQAYYFYTAAS